MCAEVELQWKLARRPHYAPSISAFPKGLWRIDWIGDLAFPDRTVRRKQSSVFVHLSRLKSESILDEPHLLLYPDCTAPARFQKKIWVSVGALSLLRVGDIWRDGKLEDQPDYEQETFADVQVDGSTSHIIKAGLKQDDVNGYLLPLAEHPWHVNCTQSYCVMVRLNEDRRLIIPCMELVRFYFGSSSELLSRIFLPGLKRETLYSKATFHLLSGHLNLDLAEGISGASAADIGRISQNPHAWRAAVRVSTSALTASIKGAQIYPQTLFPFEGMTTLMASGKWLSNAGKPRSTFLVYRLKSCSYPFPFRALKYEAKSVRARSWAPQGASSDVKTGTQGSSQSGTQTIVEKDASNNLAAKRRIIHHESKFPDLLPKYVWKARTLNASGSRHTSSADVAQAAVGEGGSERRVRSVDLLVLQGRPGQRRLPDFLRATVEEALLIKDIGIEVLTSSDHDGWTVPVTLLADEDGELDSKLFFESAAGIPTLRRACVLAFRKAEVSSFVVIIEAPSPCIRLYAPVVDSDSPLWDALSRATADFLREPKSENISLSERVSLAFKNMFPQNVCPPEDIKSSEIPHENSSLF
ncbi:hypothetical protein DT070_05145 [Polaromonas sp. SP1]|nr:hypothetical protein DT070_05145 [Polaromonas sp. SP1]